jgi:hypothetical protein
MTEFLKGGECLKLEANSYSDLSNSGCLNLGNQASSFCLVAIPILELCTGQLIEKRQKGSTWVMCCQ